MNAREASLQRGRDAVLIGLHVVLAAVTWQQVTHYGDGYQLWSGFGRYFTLGTEGGVPYRDFAAEYPPLAVGLFRLLGQGTFDQFVRSMLVVNIAAQACIAWVCFKGWGRRAAWSYLALSAPLVTILYSRYDLVVVAIAALGALAVKQQRPFLAGLAWACGSFVKVWPVVLIPGLVARGHRRAAALSIGAGAAGMLAWVAWAGVDGPHQVLTYRDARGWEFHSVPGSLLRLLTRGELRLETGAWRLGAPPLALTVVFVLALIALLAAIWWLAAGRDVADGVAEVSALAAVLVTGTLLSPQFIAWLLPWVAIAAAVGVSRIERWAAVNVGLTLLGWIALDVNNPGNMLFEVVIVARNVALVGLLVVAISELYRSPRHASLTRGHAALTPENVGSTTPVPVG